ncbi:hypothetical protein JAAARDRAFT_438198 [Jaapia argillacea MUCL 33604]|uniref:Uncharacterized protein n=1 Tax=Jaapia argillacea MUCL 33604 TaxID=933084 RepID=A0A067PEJ8_9AGAM|nr:hypothetical protein JAAARDRAFT_438198 [Jaapia argillacea MUCL 33604]
MFSWPKNSQISSTQSLNTLSLPALYRNFSSLAVVDLSNVAVTSDHSARYAPLMRRWVHDLGEATGNIHMLLLSQRYRMFLYEVLTSLNVDGGTIRRALRDDEAQILNQLQSVLQSESHKKEVLSLENENAEGFLVLLQDVCGWGPLKSLLLKAQALKTLTSL